MGGRVCHAGAQQGQDAVRRRSSGLRDDHQVEARSRRFGSVSRARRWQHRSTVIRIHVGGRFNSSQDYTAGIVPLRPRL